MFTSRGIVSKLLSSAPLHEIPCYGTPTVWEGFTPSWFAILIRLARIFDSFLFFVLFFFVIGAVNRWEQLITLLPCGILAYCLYWNNDSLITYTRYFKSMTLYSLLFLITLVANNRFIWSSWKVYALCLFYTRTVNIANIFFL